MWPHLPLYWNFTFGSGWNDAVWKYPHKDELIKSLHEQVRGIIDIVRRFGREVVTLHEYRRMVGP
jgi:hypothetical protein